MVLRSFDTSPVSGLSRPGRPCCAVTSVPISTYRRIPGGQSDVQTVAFNTIRFNVHRDTIFFYATSARVRAFGRMSVKVRGAMSIRVRGCGQNVRQDTSLGLRFDANR